MRMKKLFTKDFLSNLYSILFNTGTIEVATNDGYVKKHRIFGKTLKDKESIDKNDPNMPVFYFKVNRIADYTLANIQSSH